MQRYSTSWRAASKLGLKDFTISSAPDVMIDKVPAWAPEAPPLTAALINFRSLSASTFLPNSPIKSGARVLMTIIVLPLVCEDNNPFSPKIISTF